MQLGNPGGLNLTAYWVSGPGGDYVTIINKSQGAQAADAAVTIAPPGPGRTGAEAITLAAGSQGTPAEHGHAGGAAITGGAAWDGSWSVLPADPGGAGISLTVRAATAAVVRIGPPGQ